MKTMKKWVALLCVVALCFSLASCMLSGKKENQTTPNQQENKQPAGKAETFVTLDINPSIELTLDANGIVASVYGANEDGQILLYEEAENIIGLTYEAAVEYITKLAADLDYLTVDTEQIRALYRQLRYGSADGSTSATVNDGSQKKTSKTISDFVGLFLTKMLLCPK